MILAGQMRWSPTRLSYQTLRFDISHLQSQPSTCLPPLTQTGTMYRRVLLSEHYLTTFSRPLRQPSCRLTLSRTPFAGDHSGIPLHSDPVTISVPCPDFVPTCMRLVAISHVRCRSLGMLQTAQVLVHYGPKTCAFRLG